MDKFYLAVMVYSKIKVRARIYEQQNSITCTLYPTYEKMTLFNLKV
jgi:hypothetical protein